MCSSRRMRAVVGVVGAFLLASGTPAWASGGGQISVINFYQYFIDHVVSPGQGSYWWPICSSLFTLLLIVVLGLAAGFYRLKLSSMSDEELLPPSRFGVRAFLEMSFDVVSSTLDSIIGHRWQKFAWLLGGTFFFILLCNLVGVFPGFAPATEQMNMTLPIATVIFVAFNIYGIRYSGWGYIKHLFGPVLWLAPLMFIIEVVGTFARPVSLSLRLFGNITGDHLVFSVFSTICRNFHISWLPFPAVFLGFGTFVAALQAFIFMSLSAVYVKLAIEVGDHDHE